MTIQKTQSGFSEDEARSISGFILSVGGFLLNQRLFSETLFTQKETGQMVKAIRFIVRYGLSGHSGKSSLYFYFDNKEQMIEDVVGSEKERLTELIIERITGFESFEEQLYCIFYVMTSYFLLKPSIFTIMNWLRYQFVNKPLKPADQRYEKFSEFINIVTMTSSFNPLGFSADLIAEGLSFILIHGLWECMGTNCSPVTMKLHIRKIHQLFLYGLKGSQQ